MGHDTMPAEERVEASENKATGNSTITNVSISNRKQGKDQYYKVSNNFD